MKAAATVGVLTAGGGGTYWYWNSRPSDDANRSQAHSATEQLKNLFASSDDSTPSSGQLPTGSSQTASPKSSENRFAVNNPPTALLGDRYAKYSQAVAAPVASPIDLAAKSAGVDVARGQGPDVNPLRGEIQQTAVYEEANELDARAGFASALAQAQPLQPTPAVNQPAAGAFGQNPFASKSPAGSPIVTPPPAVDNRYASAAAAPTLPPVIDMAKVASTSTAREPVSAFGTNLGAIPVTSPAKSLSLEPQSSGITSTPGLASQPGSGRPGERILEGTQSPSITIQKLAPPEIQVGKRCTFAIRVQNTGQRTAQGVQIHDEIPLGTELVGTAPRAAVSGTQVSWDLGTLSVGEERTVEMELIPTEEGELGSVATITLAAQASAKARCTKPELALRLSSQPQVHVGQTHLVQIEITNPGTGEASGVMLLETVPAGVSHEAGPALEFEIGALGPGESRRLELVLTAEQAGRVTNSMTAKADAGLMVEASCEFEVIAPDLRLTVEGPDRRFLERPATYQVSIENPGTAPAKEVQVVTHLPKGLQFVSANNLGEYDAAQHSVFWSLAELPANERGTVELVALPVEPGQHTLQVSTRARDGLTDEFQKEVTVEGIAALMFEVVDRADPIEVGGETTYEIRVVNQGSKAAANLQVVAIMPPGLRAISGNGDSRHTVQGDRVVFAPVPQLGPKAESTFRIQAQGVRAGDQRIRVQITTDEIREPITKEESTRVYSDH